MNPREFFSDLYGDATDGYLTLFFIPSKKTEWFKIGSKLPALPKNQNCYFGIGIRRQQEKEGRGKLVDVIGIPGFWLDLDFMSGDAHKATVPLPPDVAACEALLDECPLPPSMLVHSGHGLQVYWLFNEPWYFADKAEHERASKLAKGWQGWFQAQAKEKGWHVDSTADLTRVFRIPGSLNRKSKPFLDVVVKSNNPYRYEPSDFDDYISTDVTPTVSASPNTIEPKSADIIALPNISDRMKYLILHGDTLNKYPSRSEAVFAAINSMIGAAREDDEIAGILLDDRYQLSEMPREKGERWLAHEIARAHQKTRDDFHSEVGSFVQANKKDPVLEGWRDNLLTKKDGSPTMNLTNLGLILENHPEWAGAFWWDTVRGTPMLREEPLNQEDIVHIGQWLGIHERMAVSTTRPLEQTIVTLCHNNERDLIQIWLNSLPSWDGVPRLDDWLIDCAGVQKDAYGMAISRIIPLSMVARAMEPGCRYRFVVIFEGAENTGKSSLVRAIASPEWYAELSIGLDSKESHMMLQGAWLAEMPELDSLNRSEETRLKAFITFLNDSYIPKYSNFKVSIPRRAIFIGTTNDESYLKGETGNTRFLPIKTRDIDVSAFQSMREQIFAEAYAMYTLTPLTWWEMSEDALEQAKVERDNRRVINVYEEPLEEWLEGLQTTTWREIARDFLRLDPASWKDKSLQMQIAAALKVLGWRRSQTRAGEKIKKVWEKPHVPTNSGYFP